MTEEMLDVKSFLHLMKDITNISDPSTLKLIGQERDGTLIYTYRADPAQAQGGAPVSHIGIYEPLSKKSKVVLVHDKDVNIVNCSIDHNHTFIGFVTVETISVTGAQGRRQKQDVYRAFLSEIKPQNRTFYLNLERESYLKLQFIYGTTKTPITSTREAHMLVFLHKESIGLYHLPVRRESEDCAVLNGEPRKEQVVHKKFIWSQWDLKTQCLFVVYFRKHGKDSQGATTYLPLLSCYRLTKSATTELMFEYVIGLPLQYSMTRTKSQYMEGGPFHCIPDDSLNMCVLLSQNGSIILCYQKQSCDQKKNDNSALSLQYSILVLHHGKTLTCRCNHLPHGVARTARLHFSWLGDYVLVYLPGYFTQLLNLAVEFEPSHHISWKDPRWVAKSPETLATQQNDGSVTPGYLVPFVDDRYTESLSTCVYEPSTGTVFRVRVCDRVVCDIFRSSIDVPTRAAFLHYSLLHAKDLILTQRLFRILCADTAHPDLSNVLEEFLIASTFGLMRTKVDISLLRCFPFTCFPTFRGQVLNDSANKIAGRLLSMSYSNLSLAGFVDKRQGREPYGRMWDYLFTAIKLHACISRLDYRSIKQVMDQEALQKLCPTHVPNPSLFRRLEAAAKSAFSSYQPGVATADQARAPFSNQGSSEEAPLPESGVPARPAAPALSRTDQILGALPPFMSTPGDEFQMCKEQAFVLQKTVELTTNHLVKQIKKEPRSKLKAVAEEYTRNQMHMSRLLCHLIWSILGSDNSDFISLSFYTCSDEEELFSILERYHTATERLAFPQPPGFRFYFTSLAFRNLSLRRFLQYADRGVVHVSLEFVTQLLENLDDSGINHEAKYQAIARLPRAEAIECLHSWDHPACKRFLASKYTTTCITDDGPVGWEIFPTPPNLLTGDTRSQGSSSDHRSLSSNLFPPVKTLIRLLENKDPGLPFGECLGNLNLDSRYIEEAALLNTYANTRSELCQMKS